MQKFTTTIKKTFLAVVVCAQVFAWPASVFAQEAATPNTTVAEPSASTVPPEAPVSAPATEPPPPVPPPTPTPATSSVVVSQPATTTSNPGPQQPNGASAPTYTYNERTGLWENEHYTWDPATKQTVPKADTTYSYNPATGMWDTVEMRYDAPSGKYVPQIVSSPQPPEALAALVSDTGPSSLNGIDSSNTTTGFFSGFFNASISNNISSSARSGNASVLQNTNGGNAITGDAQGIVNVLNMLQSSWDPAWGDIATFYADIAGDINGDLYLDVSQLGPDSTTTVSDQSKLDLDVVISSDAQINNNIAVNAQSGNALVSENTNAGNAESGSAAALANILNLINSRIYAGQSFIGVINIEGNFNGDILAPFISGGTTISSTGPNSNTSLSGNNTSSLDVNLNDTTAINNDLNLIATTGAATVSGNTTAGNASSGDATTNLVLLNLTGKEIVASNAVLVFVNVLGQWVGLIMDAPAGSTAAAIGSGATVNANTSREADIDITATSENRINNNVDLTALSGNAAVTDNTIGGNATSGDAHAGANVLNMVGSDLTLSNWFGVLFINVLGNWYGSFGVDTAAGNLAVTNNPSSSGSPGGGMFQFVSDNPQVTHATSSATGAEGSSSGGFSGSGYNGQAALASTTVQSPVATNSSSSPSSYAAESTANTNEGGGFPTYPLAIGSAAAGILLLGGERLTSRIRNRFTT